jgi:hypothetical protein
VARVCSLIVTFVIVSACTSNTSSDAVAPDVSGDWGTSYRSSSAWELRLTQSGRIIGGTACGLSGTTVFFATSPVAGEYPSVRFVDPLGGAQLTGAFDGGGALVVLRGNMSLPFRRLSGTTRSCLPPR